MIGGLVPVSARVYQIKAVRLDSPDPGAGRQVCRQTGCSPGGINRLYIFTAEMFGLQLLSISISISLYPTLSHTRTDKQMSDRQTY